jgi:diguanylate cyclase (GGDEF)-like protein
MVDLVFVFDEEARFQFCHTSSDVLLSPPAEFLGKRHAEVMPASINEMFEKAFEKNRKGESAGYEYPVDLEEGTSWFSVKLSPIFLKDCFSGAVAVVRDITDQKALESQLSRQAFTDTITGLPNRALLMDRLGQCIARIPRSEGYLGAVLFVDLDRFKIINDSLGHHVGDLVLKEFADRMAGLVRPSDTVARLGGDEFVFLIDGVSDELDAVRVAERLKEALADPIRVGDRSIHVTVSIGIALLDGRVRSPENVLRDADAAMYRAKEGGRDQYALFNEDMYLHALKTLETERDLHRALEHNELEVHFQPILSLEKKRIVGFEALVRWNHPERGLVMPGEFIPMAEESGLIVLLDHWVLRKSCLQMLEWQREFPELQSDPVWLSVNYSARHFDRPSAIRELTVLLAETGFNPRNLLLEITESVFIRHPHIIRPLLDQIQGLGVQLSLDDFGTGYSSLGYLHHFSVNLLKIDGSFVRNLTDQPRTEGIVRAILTLAEQLNLTVVAEGIETREQSASLRGLGCTLGQGYLFSRPVPAGDIRALLSQHVSGM